MFESPHIVESVRIKTYCLDLYRIVLSGIKSAEVNMEAYNILVKENPFATPPLIRSHRLQGSEHRKALTSAMLTLAIHFRTYQDVMRTTIHGEAHDEACKDSKSIGFLKKINDKHPKSDEDLRTASNKVVHFDSIEPDTYAEFIWRDSIGYSDRYVTLKGKDPKHGPWEYRLDILLWIEAILFVLESDDDLREQARRYVKNKNQRVNGSSSKKLKPVKN